MKGAAALMTNANADKNASVPKDLSVYVPEKTRKPGEASFAFLCMAFGALGYYFAMGMTSDSLSAPSVFPKIASTLIALCGLICLGKAFLKEKPLPAERSILRFLLPKDVVFMLGMLLVYCLALPHIGFITSSYVFMVVGMIYLHRGKKIPQSLAVSAVALAVLVTVFRYVFMVMLPESVFFK
jgi:hypothetical protein